MYIPVTDPCVGGRIYHNRLATPGGINYIIAHISLLPWADGATGCRADVIGTYVGSEVGQATSYVSYTYKIHAAISHPFMVNQPSTACIYPDPTYPIRPIPTDGPRRPVFTSLMMAM